MRLFATGAVNWVMGKTLPEDVPLEAKMVTKAIERAQTTVEQRNAEIRKNVLKYDEVMNEQRKVIYALRDQVLDEADLRDGIIDEALPDAVNTSSRPTASASTGGVGPRRPAVRRAGSGRPPCPPSSCAGLVDHELYEMLMAEALTRYEEHEAKLGPDCGRWSAGSCSA